MRIACVAGFFNPVKTSLEKHCAKELADRSVVWVPQNANGVIDLPKFKASFFDAVAKRPTDMFVVMFILRGKEFQREAITSFAAEAQRRSPGIQIEIHSALKNARDGDGVVRLIQKFGPSAKKTYPDDINGLPIWIKDNHDLRVILHPRAERGISRSQYEDVPLVYEAVEVLATEYHAMRLTTVDEADKKRAVCQNRLQELGLELAPSISASRAGEEGDEYKVQYPIGGDKKRLLDSHLKKGSDREERHCLRIYFFWDDDAKKVVIGWLPSHLDTRAS